MNQARYIAYLATNQKGLQTKMIDNIMFIRQANVHYMVPMLEQLG